MGSSPCAWCGAAIRLGIVTRGGVMRHLGADTTTGGAPTLVQLTIREARAAVPDASGPVGSRRTAGAYDNNCQGCAAQNVVSQVEDDGLARLERHEPPFLPPATPGASVAPRPDWAPPHERH
jgi:hypothetical protein